MKLSTLAARFEKASLSTVKHLNALNVSTTERALESNEIKYENALSKMADIENLINEKFTKEEIKNASNEFKILKELL
jgi:hypothetical protein